MVNHRTLCVLVTLALSTLALPTPAQQTPAAQAKQVAKKVVSAAKKGVKAATKTTQKVEKHLAATPSWDALKAAYDYDSSAAPDVKEEPVANENVMVLHITFTGPDGKPVNGTFMRPKADGVYPCALVMHGLTNNKETSIKLFGNRLVAKGIAILALDAPQHGKDQPPNKKYWNDTVYTAAVHQGVRNYRRALDYLTARPDIDKEHIAAIGNSMGAIMCAIIGSVDDRIQALSLCVGGDPFLAIARTRSHPEDYDVSPSLFIAHFAPRPVVMYNSKTDPVMVLPAAYMLQNAAKDPKQVVWFSGTHDVPEAIRQRAEDWIVTKVGASQVAAKADAPKPASP
ncbi:MAG: esterase [Chthonomonadaceae bacterium]|nr:esterase [Chthonomonadaceae bacterium]